MTVKLVGPAPSTPTEAVRKTDLDAAIAAIGTPASKAFAFFCG